MFARVLVVDDIPANLRLLEAKLLVEYYEILTATDGPGALEAAANQAPDIILLDVMMPGMDEYEVCRRLKADPQTAHIPVIMVTALGETAERVMGLEAGADDFLTKPVKDNALFARIRSLVRLKFVHDEWRTREAAFNRSGADGPDAVDGADLPGRVLLAAGGDDPSNIAAALTERGHVVAIARSADEIRTHLAEAEFDLVLLNDEDDGQDGLRLCSVIRSQEATRNVPIVLMVHEGEDGRLAKGFEIGISDYLVKPLDRDEMHARARTQIRRKRYESALRVAYRRSLTAAVTDSLTGLHNRRYLETHFKALEETLRPVGKPLSLMLLDVDHFKAINDSHGHAAGDVVLQGIAGRIMGTLRGVDTAVRLGGEEFVVLMPNATLSQSLAAADRLREEIAQKPFAISGEEGSIPVTVSIGVVNAAAGEADLAALLGRADKALYRAKAEGRDRVVVAGGHPAGSAATAQKVA